MRQQSGLLAFLYFLAIITYLDRVCISVAGPRMQQDLNISPGAWGVVGGAFVLAYAVFEIPSGALGDRIGARAVLTRIVLWWSAFTALTGFVSNFYVLVLTRFLFGMGEAGAYPNAQIAISQWFPPSSRAFASSVVLVGSQCGGILGPLLVVPLQSRYGWRVSFYVFACLGVVWALAWYAWFRDRPAQQPGGTVRTQTDKTRDHREAHPRLPWSTVVRKKSFWAILGIAACYFYTVFFFQSWFHTYLVKGRGYAEQDLLLSAFPYLVAALAAGCGGLASDLLVRRCGLRWGRRIIGIVGLGTAAIATGVLMGTESPRWALACLSLMYGGIAFQQPTVFAVCLDIGGNHAGSVTGAMNTAAQIGSFVSSLLFGYLITMSGNYNDPFIPMAALLLVGTGLWFLVDASQLLITEAVEHTPHIDASQPA